MRKLILVPFLASLLLAEYTLAGEPVLPVDSAKDIEHRIAAALKERLKLDASLKAMGADAEDVGVVAVFGENEEQGVPRLLVIADTRILAKKGDEVVSQVISVSSVAELTLKTESRLKLLEWANTWNNNVLPVRIQIANDKIIANRNLVTTIAAPLTEEQILQAYLAVLQLWPALMDSLRKEELI